ncbi:MAG: 8-oxoguanine DNA glycosylase [Clostridia bacterium]|jgi:N-glycosylase/DNA lyase|nr:8-oxoguanine DNA glycosylase [Clostridia bacterium]
MIKYIEKNNNIEVENIKCFNIANTLECGQCFRFRKKEELDYYVIAHERILRVKQEKNKLTFFDLNKEEFEDIWVEYFDLNRNYRELLDIYDDNHMKEAKSLGEGIRILKQEPFECLLSFIISQNQRIPRIKIIINNVCRMFGEKIGEIDGEEIYSFPSPNRLKEAEEIDFIDCKAGFRAKYLKDAIDKINNKELNLLELTELNTEELKLSLESIKGVGNKVSDCVMLFSYARYEVFPVDVWVKRVMKSLYDIDEKEIKQFKERYFGDYAGIAQQYLFHYMRTFKG